MISLRLVGVDITHVCVCVCVCVCMYVCMYVCVCCDGGVSVGGWFAVSD